VDGMATGVISTSDFLCVCPTASLFSADIKRAFQQLGPQLEVDVDGSDLANNPFYNRVIHIQALSDAGHQMIGVISGAIMEFTVIEDRHVQYLRKLLRIHEHGCRPVRIKLVAFNIAIIVFAIITIEPSWRQICSRRRSIHGNGLANDQG